MPAIQQAPRPELLRVEGLSKRYGGLAALSGVSFAVARGEVHAVVGENGAGKSTLMRILAGVERPDEGRILLDGEPVELASPLEARRRGLEIVFQEPCLFPRLTVAANLFAGRERTGPLGLLDERGMAAASRAALDSLGAAIDPRSRAGDLSVGERQLVEIARALAGEPALAGGPRIIILDEPNSALGGAESERLFDTVRRLRERGVTVLYVSHRLEEVFALADRITVLRDGRHRATWSVGETEVSRVVEAMVGRRLDEAFPRPVPAAGDPPPPRGRILLEARGLEWGRRLGPVSFILRAGEILGVAGLEGSGIDELFQLLFGLEAPTAGELIWPDGSAAGRSPAAAIGRGVGLIPRSRREEGLVMDWPIRKNATLLVLDRLARRAGGLIDGAREREEAEGLSRRLNLAAGGVEKRVGLLSGGNQQKVVLAKWLAAGPRVLLLHDPTRGVDVGAKAEIYRLCERLAREGLGLLFASSEIEETLGLSDRILVLSRGLVARECRRGEATKGDLLRSMMGGA